MTRALSSLVFNIPAVVDRDGRWHASRVVVIQRLDYRTLWRSSNRIGRYDLRQAPPATWKLDGLWSAACYQIRAEAAERLADEMMARGADAALLSDLIDDVEREWLEAHTAYVENLPKYLRAHRAVSKRDRSTPGPHAA